MSAGASSRSSLEALAMLRARAREQAEQEIVGAVTAEQAAAVRVARAELALSQQNAKNASILAEALAAARTGDELMAVESLSRAAREDVARLREALSEALRRKDEASLAITRARSGLARAEAEEKAVAGRLEALEEAERAARFAREDDEADERSQRSRGGG